VENGVIAAVNTVVYFEDEIRGYNTGAVSHRPGLENFSGTTLKVRACSSTASVLRRALPRTNRERGAERVVFATRSPERTDGHREIPVRLPEQPISIVSLGDAAKWLPRGARGVSTPAS
jgi:hypothetical protein